MEKRDTILYHEDGDGGRVRKQEGTTVGEMLIQDGDIHTPTFVFSGDENRAANKHEKNRYTQVMYLVMNIVDELLRDRMKISQILLRRRKGKTVSGRTSQFGDAVDRYFV